MIKWVVISDLHAGGSTSLLRACAEDDTSGQKVVTQFTNAIAAFLKHQQGDKGSAAQLVLLGDVLDLQFSKRSTATSDAVPFLSALQDTGCFEPKVLATAGNHDHAIWAEARLALEAHAFEAAIDETPYHTKAFTPTEEATSRLLSAVLKCAGFDGLDLRYPNIGFSKGDRAVLLHHGHYIEGGYRLVSKIKDALCARDGEHDIKTLCAENASWIDFAWSPLNGAEELEWLYQNFLTTTGFRRIARDWSDRSAKMLSEALPASGNANMQKAVRIGTKLGFELLLDRARDTERMAEVISLTPHGREGLLWYLEGPVRGQLKEELPSEPQDLTFVLGHTHRPFSLRVKADGYAEPIRVYNTGGWTLNGPRLDNAEGAAVVLIDDALNVASLRLFSTPRNGEVPEARIEMLSNGSPGEQEFKAQLDAALEHSKSEWEQLRSAAGKAYAARQRLLLDMTDGPRSAAE